MTAGNSEPRDRPVLYSFRRCPYAMRARLAIARNTVAVDLREVVLRDKPAHMIELSPKATVPVLWLEDGSVIDESLDIMIWAWARGGKGRPDDAPHYDLVARIDGDFKYHLDRYKYATRYDPVAGEAHRAAALGILRDIEPLLERPWLSGSEPGFADLAILPFVRQYRIADPAWFDAQPELTGVQDWLAGFLDWPGFHAVMKKYPQWCEGDPSVPFGAS
ncbi:MAG: glutathione S-transferase [Hyphomicrobiales bacterium]|nr:glutathione S-transferase [Hyphomicrobiales bacterium]